VFRDKLDKFSVIVVNVDVYVATGLVNKDEYNSVLLYVKWWPRKQDAHRTETERGVFAIPVRLT